MKGQGIYAITHIASGRVYVGSTTKFSIRWRSHKWELKGQTHNNHILQSAWNEYGEDAFTFSVLEYVQITADLAPREQHWIDTLDAFFLAGGFNLRPTAENNTGHKHTPQTKDLIQSAQLRAWANPDRKTIHTERMNARFDDPAWRGKLGKWMKTEAASEWITKRNKEWWSNEENRENMRQKAKIRCTPEFIAKCRAAGACKQTPEHRAKHSARLKARMADPLEIEKIREAIICVGIARIERDVAKGKEISRWRRRVARKHLTRLSPAAVEAVKARKAPNGKGKRRLKMLEKTALHPDLFRGA